MATKSILKLKTTDTSSPQKSKKAKNVRFDLFSTTIKRFDSKDEPITISNENSPIMSPILFPVRTNHLRRGDEYGYYSSGDGNGEDDDESCWFNNLSVLPNLVKFDKKFNNIYKKSKLLNHNSSNHHNNPLELESFYRENDLSLSDFDLDDDDDDDDDDDATLDNFNDLHSGSRSNSNDSTNYVTDGNVDSMMDSNERLISDVDIRWKLIHTNVPSKPNDLDISDDHSIEHYLNGQNIKLYNLEQSRSSENKLSGFLIVNNLNFEKIIEIKFTFNNWNNIHYINSTYNKSLTSKFDEFHFVIDLNRYKFFLQIKDLLNRQIKIDLCCRYDVGKETYFDNNNYQNYTLTLSKIINANEIDDSNKKLPFWDTLSSLPSSLSSSPSPPPTSLAALPSPPSLTSLQKNSYMNYYMNNTNSTDNVLSAGTSKTPITTTSTTNNNNNHGYTFLNSNKFVVPMTQRQFNRNRGLGHSRTFSEDTDYFNTSPLKHLYHNDTCEFVRKPATINEVLNIETNPAPLPELLPGPSIAATKSSINLFGSFSQQSGPEPVQLGQNSSTPSTIGTSTSASTLNPNTTSNVNISKLPGSQHQTIRKQPSPPLIKSLEERSLSGSSLSSSNSSASFASFQSDNFTAKRKNDSLTSSTSSDSATIPNLSISLTNLTDSKKKIAATDITSNNKPTDVVYLSNYISRQNGDLSSTSSLTNNEDDLFNMKHPTLDYFNSNLTASPSINSNSIDNQQDETQSIDTDTTFKNTTTNNNSSNNITMPIPRPASSLENRDVTTVIDNPTKYIPTQNLFQNSTPTDNINDNKKTKPKNTGTNSILQDNSVKNMDYQTLLHSYCFFTSSPSTGDSTINQAHISPSSSPAPAMYL